jgi:signal transduction histidine kinase
MPEIGANMENRVPPVPWNLACKMLEIILMQSIENFCIKIEEPAVGADVPMETARNSDTEEYISPAVAHELNNVIAIIRGYTDRLLVKNAQNPALEPHLKLISDAARRAGNIVHAAMSQNPVPARPSPVR